MMSEHLSEEAIQDFALQQPETVKQSAAHVDACISCRSRVESYRLLFDAIADSTAPVFDFDVEAVVTAAMTPALVRKQKGFNALIACVLTITAIIVGISIYFPALFTGLSFYGGALIFVTVIILLAGQLAEMFRSYRKKIKLLDVT